MKFRTDSKKNLPAKSKKHLSLPILAEMCQIRMMSNSINGYSIKSRGWGENENVQSSSESMQLRRDEMKTERKITKTKKNQSS